MAGPLLEKRNRGCRGAARSVDRTAPRVRNYLQQAVPLQHDEPLQQDALALLSALGPISNSAATRESKSFLIEILLIDLSTHFDSRADKLLCGSTRTRNHKSRVELFLDPENTQCEEAIGLGERGCRRNQRRGKRDNRDWRLSADRVVNRPVGRQVEFDFRLAGVADLIGAIIAVLRFAGAGALLAARIGLVFGRGGATGHERARRDDDQQQRPHEGSNDPHLVNTHSYSSAAARGWQR